MVARALGVGGDNEVSWVECRVGGLREDRFYEAVSSTSAIGWRARSMRRNDVKAASHSLDGDGREALARLHACSTLYLMYTVSWYRNDEVKAVIISNIRR